MPIPHPRRLASLLFLVALAGLATAPATAQPPATGGADLLGEVTLFGEEDLVVEAATKTELPLSKAPGSVTVVTAQQIKESGARTIPELLRLVAGVNVRWNPMVQSLDIRSFGQTPFTSRVLLLIDGIPFNAWDKGGFPQHPGFDFFMLQTIKRLEIVRGPGSALYGENAYWGVINIVTLSGEDLQGGKVEAYGGDLETRTLSALYGIRGQKGSLLVSARAYNGQLPIQFWREDVGSEASGSDFFLKATSGDLAVEYYRHDDELDGFDVPGFQPGSHFRSAETIEQSIDIGALKYGHEWGSGVSFAADFTYAQRHGSRCAACHAAPERESFSTTVNHGNQLIGDFRLGLKMIPSHDILIGVEARRVDAGNHDDELLTPDETDEKVVLDYSKVAAYVQDQISLWDDRFRITLGGRYDGDNDLFDSELSPRIAFVVNPSERLVFRGGWSTAFRFPVFSELYQDSWFLGLDFGTTARPSQIFEPNPDLEPEEIRTFDLGTEIRFSPAFSAKLDLYQSEVIDFIVLAFRRGPTGTPTRLRSENSPDRATLRGGELELRYRPGTRFNGVFNYAYQESSVEDHLLDSSGTPLELVYAPENKINLGAYFGPFSGFRFSIEAMWRDERIAPAFWSSIGRPAGSPPLVLDAYTLVNARVSWTAPFHLGRSDEALRLSVYGRNLLDETYRETQLPIGMEMPPTTYYGAIELRF